MGRLDVRHPVAHRLVDRVLERRRAGCDGAHLGTEGAHPKHVRSLALDVLRAHVHDARQVEQGAGRRRRDPMLAGTGLRDDPGLAQTPREQRLTEGVVDLVRPRVGQVLALEVEAQVRDPGTSPSGGPGGVTCQPDRLGPDGLSEAVGAVEGGRTTREMRQQVAQLGPEHRVLAEGVIGGLELFERGHQRLRHVATTEVALHPPPPGAVGVEQPGMDWGRTEGDIGAIVAGGPGTLDEERDQERVLDRADPGFPGSFDARRDVDGGRRDVSKRTGHVGRSHAPREDDGHLAGDRGGKALRARACRSRPDAARPPRRA